MTVELKQEYREYLDDLRESGDTNMFCILIGALPYLRAEFPELSDIEARSVLTQWMHSYEAIPEVQREDQQGTTGEAPSTAEAEQSVPQQKGTEDSGGFDDSGT